LKRERITTGCSAPQDVACASKADLADPNGDFRYAPESGLKADIAARPKSADFVAKVGCNGSGRYAFR
jgi:hypothetical protein